MSDSRHPCGALPVTGWSISLWYCDHHQAYWAMAGAYRQTSDDDLENLGHRTMDFGPFDSVEDVERWLQGEWRTMRSGLPRPGMPATGSA